MSISRIAGYMWRGKPFCRECIGELFVSPEAAWDDNPQRQAEAALDHLAARAHIDRDQTPSSYRFPQPLYADEVLPGDACDLCGVPLRPERGADYDW